MISNNGNKDIIVLSGTEKVWANGKKLIRGENHDYTIDYSLGQVFFTPEILIYDDIKLLFEYEYSDFDYEKSFTGGSLKKIKNGLGELTLGIYQESDIYDKNSLITEFNKDLIQEKDGITQIKTAFEDDKGDYFLKDSVYIFDPDKNNQNSKRYFVTFNYDLMNSVMRIIKEKNIEIGAMQEISKEQRAKFMAEVKADMEAYEKSKAKNFSKGGTVGTPRTGTQDYRKSRFR